MGDQPTAEERRRRYNEAREKAIVTFPFERVQTSGECRSQPLRTYQASRPLTGLLFVADMDGQPIRADTLRKTMRAHLDRLGLNNLHFHGLRHTAATALAEAGSTPQLNVLNHG